MNTRFKFYSIYLFIFCCAFAQNTFSQTEIVPGYKKDIKGETLNYWSFYFSENNPALLVRCNNKATEIAWETETVDAKTITDSVTFIWLCSYNVGTSSAPHNFILSVNQQHSITFKTGQTNTAENWNIINDGMRLNFQLGGIDHVKDYSGYMYLTVPKSYLLNNKLSLKVLSDNINSPDWFMVFKKQLRDTVTATPVMLVENNETKKNQQVVRFRADNFGTENYARVIDGFADGDKTLLQQKLKPGINIFEISFPRVDKTITKNLSVFVGKKYFNISFDLKPFKEYTVYIQPHSHLDIGYTVTPQEALQQHINNIEEGISLAEKTQNYPEGARYRWNVEGLWVVENYLQKATPEQTTRFINAVKKGWVACDAFYCNELTSLCRPEELFQSVAYSNKLEKLTGTPIKTAMMSDVPGYNWNLVSVLAQNGVKYFSLGPNTFDRIGNTISAWGDKPFWWLSPSGNDSVLFWMSSLGYSSFHQHAIGDNRSVDPLLKYMEKLSAENYPYDMTFISYTIGGDNGTNDNNLPDFVKNWNTKYASPKLIIATSAEIFSAFDKKYGKQLPTQKGDFTPYWEDGAYSAAYECVVSRRAADKLQLAGTLNAVFNRTNKLQSDFTLGWENVMLYSEHTYGSWNSVDDPECKLNRDIWTVKSKFTADADSISNSLMLPFAPTKPASLNSFNIFNSLNWKRTGVVIIPNQIQLNGDFDFTQTLADGSVAMMIKNIDGLSTKSISITDETKSAFDYSNGVLSNNKIKVYINSITGNIEKVIHTTNGTFDFSSGKGINQFIYTGSNAANPQTDKNIKIVIKEKGSLLNTIQIISEAPGCKSLIREISLISGDDKIYINNIIDKERVLEKENIRFAFPFNMTNCSVKMDIGYAVIEPEKDQLNGSNKNYFTINQWINISDKNKSITLHTPDAPLIETGSMTAENWLSDISKKWSNNALISSTIFSWVMNNSWHTNYRAYQNGLVNFRYVLQFDSTYNQTANYKTAFEIAQPLQTVSGKYAPINESYINISTDKIILTDIHPAKNGDGYILRLFNSSIENISTDIKPSFKFQSINLTDGDEHVLDEIKNAQLQFAPFEVRNIVIR